MTSISFDTARPRADSVEVFASQLSLSAILDRAISFHPEIGTRLRRIRVEWDGGLKREAGRFSTRDGILLHPGLRAAGQTALVETFLHELAHAMQWLAYAKIDHRATWQEMVYQLGQQPERFHNISQCMGKIQPKTLGLNPEDLDL